MSTIKVDTVQSTSGGVVTLTNQIAAQAFINGGDDASINNSLNISTNTDVETGTYQYGFSNAFTAEAEQHCAIAGMAGGGNRTPRIASTNTDTSKMRIIVYNASSATIDSEHYVQLSGDLA